MGRTKKYKGGKKLAILGVRTLWTVPYAIFNNSRKSLSKLTSRLLYWILINKDTEPRPLIIPGVK